MLWSGVNEIVKVVSVEGSRGLRANEDVPKVAGSINEGQLSTGTVKNVVNPE